MMRTASIEDFVTELIVRNCQTCNHYSRPCAECTRTGSRHKFTDYCIQWEMRRDILDLFLPNGEDYENMI